MVGVTTSVRAVRCVPSSHMWVCEKNSQTGRDDLVFVGRVCDVFSQTGERSETPVTMFFHKIFFFTVVSSRARLYARRRQR
jgi:hypothetical protein